MARQTKATRRSPAEFIAFRFCSDIADVREAIFQPSQYARPSIFTYADRYLCAIPDSHRIPAKSRAQEWNWKPLASYYG